MERPRILVVDDDPKVLSLMDRGLAFEGYAVDVAAEGHAALDIARALPPEHENTLRGAGYSLRRKPLGS